MILPRIRDNLLNHSQINLQHDGIKELLCVADGYPEADVFWIRGFLFLAFFSWFKIRRFFLSISASDSRLLSRNFTRAILKFDNEMHGVNKYSCEARNKHGLTKIFITVIIPGV
jgi:hypothetical protein